MKYAIIVDPEKGSMATSTGAPGGWDTVEEAQKFLDWYCADDVNARVAPFSEALALWKSKNEKPMTEDEAEFRAADDAIGGTIFE